MWYVAPRRGPDGMSHQEGTTKKNADEMMAHLRPSVSRCVAMGCRSGRGPNPGAAIQPPAPPANEVSDFAILRGKMNYTKVFLLYSDKSTTLVPMAASNPWTEASSKQASSILPYYRFYSRHLTF